MLIDAHPGSLDHLRHLNAARIGNLCILAPPSKCGHKICGGDRSASLYMLVIEPHYGCPHGLPRWVGDGAASADP
jgi:hypothetical protein